MPSFGAIKALQARTGCDRATAKKALIDHDDDEEAAAAAIGECTSQGSSSTDVPPSKPKSEDQQKLDQWTEAEQAQSVSIARLESGDGQNFPEPGDSVTMHYTGSLQSDGTVFDSSISREKPFTFKVGVGAVIKGWDVGVPKMSLGEKAILFISSDYACTCFALPPFPCRRSAGARYSIVGTDLVRSQVRFCCALVWLVALPGLHHDLSRCLHGCSRLSDRVRRV